MTISHTTTRVGAKGSPKHGGNLPSGKIAPGRGPSPSVITPAGQRKTR